jgi:hypothetical protein
MIRHLKHTWQRYLLRRALQATARRRRLWTMTAVTPDGHATLAAARRLACNPTYRKLSDGELLRLAYWGATGVAPRPVSSS